MEIAKAAMDIFAQKGVEKSSIREIAIVAGIGKGTFYDYFADKNDLLSEVVNLVLDEWTGIINQTLSGVDDPLTCLKKIVVEGAKLGDSFARIMMIYTDLWRISMTTPADQTLNIQFRSFLKKTKNAVVSVVKVAQKQGSISQDINPDSLAISLIALVDGYCMHHMVFNGDIDAQTISQDFFSVIAKGLA